MTEAPSCECHGVPMGWQRDARRAPGGRWECKERRRQYNAANYQKSGEKHRAGRRERWHNGGNLVQRRRDLAKQRAQVVARLAELEQEARALVS